MVTLEFAATFPERARVAMAFAAPAVQSAWAEGWNLVQRRAIELGGLEGLAVARMVGMLTYRTPDELDSRFLARQGEVEPHAVRSYLKGHGEKLVARFDPEAYLSLMETMDCHDVGRGRGGAGAALREFRGRLVGVGIPGDVLYRADEVKGWAEAANAAFRSLSSPHGHDGFLLEREAVARLIAQELPPAPESSAIPAARREHRRGAVDQRASAP
jgi:homoserine O-acetyltransferase